MTYKELPEYCYTHMCKAFCNTKDDRKCEYEALCTRFYIKYRCTPVELREESEEE